jgi:hypothetical protein
MEPMMRRNLRNLLALAAVLASGSVAAQPPLPPGCNAKLAKDAKKVSVDGYGARGQFCEGVFKQEVANVEFRLDAFTEPAAPVDARTLGRLDTLSVEWNAPPGMKVHILARQFTDPLADFYQMDAEAVTGPNGSGSWSWPTGIMRKANMWPVAVTDARGGDRAPKVSVQASGHVPGDPPSDSVYIPVRIVPKTGAPTARTRFQVSMTAKEKVTVRRPTLVRLESDGSAKPVTMETGCDAIKGGAVGGDPVTITICMPAGAASGWYLLAIGATSDAAMIRSKGIRFYYSR